MSLHIDAVLVGDVLQGLWADELAMDVEATLQQFVTMRCHPALQGALADTCQLRNLTFVVTLHLCF